LAGLVACILFRKSRGKSLWRSLSRW